MEFSRSVFAKGPPQSFLIPHPATILAQSRYPAPLRMFSPISRIYSHLPTAVLFFFSHVTIPKAAITPSCRNKFQWISVSYSAKDLTKERTTTNESLPVSLVSEPHDYNTRSASSNQIFIPSFRSNLRRFWPGSIIGCFFWKNIPKFTRDKAS